MFSICYRETGSKNMPKMTEAELTRVFGVADAFALVSVAFNYPSDELAEALANGSFRSDLVGSLSDMDIDKATVFQLCDGISEATANKSAAELLEVMRPEYTELYYGPGKFRKMYPYESAFRKLEINPNGRATVFMTKSTHDVERSMKRRGAMPPDARREPADFFATELDFVRHLFTGYAAAVLEDGDAEAWKGDIDSFLDNHVITWIPSLFAKTRDVTNLDLYRLLAECGILVIETAREPV